MSGACTGSRRQNGIRQAHNNDIIELSEVFITSLLIYLCVVHAYDVRSFFYRAVYAPMQIPCWTHLFQDEWLAQAGRCLDVTVDPLRHEVCT